MRNVDRWARSMRDDMASLAAPLNAEAEAAEAGSFRDFVVRRNPTLLTYEHVPKLVSIGDRIATGELLRVLVLLAPRYFKTEVFSRLLSAYFLRRHPKAHVGIASYGADLSWEVSEDARNYFEEDGGQLRRETSAKKRWRAEAGGVLWALGVGGGSLGRGFHLGIVDDPVDPEQAHSPKYERRFERWWSAKFISRQEPSARIVVVMQRHGVTDPIDFLFRREVGEDADLAPEHWHVVVCDEVKSPEPLGRWSGPQGLPPTCTLEPDPRAIGELLSPSRFTAEQVAVLQRAAGTTVRDAQRQQRPSTPSGDFWRADWFTPYDELPANAHAGGRDWDMAFTANDANSASSDVRSFRGPGAVNEFPIYIDDCDWDWLEYPELVRRARSRVGPHYIEAKASGQSALQSLARESVAVSEVPVKGDKLARASAVQPIVSNKRVFVRRTVLRRLLEGERQGLLRVTVEKLIAGGPDLDLNDAFVQALHRHMNALARRPTVRPALSVSYFTPH